MEYMVPSVIVVVLAFGYFTCSRLERYYKEEFNKTLSRGLYSLNDDEMIGLLQDVPDNVNVKDVVTDVNVKVVTDDSIRDTIYNVEIKVVSPIITDIDIIEKEWNIV